MSDQTEQNRQPALATIKARLETHHVEEGNFSDPWSCPISLSLSDCEDGPVLLEPVVQHLRELGSVGLRRNDGG